MERNSLAGILTALAMIAGILGFVVYDSALTFQQVLDLVLQNPLISVPVGLLLLFVVLFGNRSGPTDDA